jgi:hypothetical protein
MWTGPRRYRGCGDFFALWANGLLPACLQKPYVFRKEFAAFALQGLTGIIKAA